MLVYEALVQGGQLVVTSGSASISTTGTVAEPLTNPANAPGWWPASEALLVHGAGTGIAIEGPGWFESSSAVCVELLTFVAAPAAPGRIASWDLTDVSVTVRPGPPIELAATATALELPLPPAAPDVAGQTSVLAPGRWMSLALLRTDRALLLAIDGVVVARRVSQAPLLALDTTGALQLGSAGASQLIAGVRVSADVPSHLEAAVTASETVGMGELASRWVDQSGQLGAPQGVVQSVGGGLAQTCEHGVITWTPASGTCTLLDAEIIQRWQALGGASGDYGFPTADETDDDGEPGPPLPLHPAYHFARFRGGVIYRMQGSPAHAFHAEIAQEHRRLGGARGRLGFPIADEQYAMGAWQTSFELGTVYWSGTNTGVPTAVLGLIDDRYRRLNGPAGWLGLPRARQAADGPAVVQDFANGSIWGAGGQAHALTAQFASAYRAAPWAGATGPFGLPVTEVVDLNGMSYCELEHGILAGPAGQRPIGLTALELRLDSVATGAIDDGGPPLFPDTTAEVYCYVTVDVDGRKVEDHRREPDSGSHDKTLQLDHQAYGVGRVRHDSRIQLDIDVMDADKLSGDDPLGHHHAEFDLTNLWGLAPPSGGLFADVPITQAFADAGGDPSRIRLTYTTGAPSQFDPNAPWRSQHWWALQNFSSGRLSRELYDETFDDVSPLAGWSGNVRHPLDSLFFEAFYAGCAKGGNCFGLSALAETSMRRPSLLRQPLTQYKNSVGPTDTNEMNVAPALRRLINKWQGVQMDSRVISWELTQLLTSPFVPHLAMDFVQALLANGDPCILAFLKKNLLGDGHATLAYRSTGIQANPRGVWVGDPNSAWGANADPDDDTFVRLSGGTFAVDSTFHGDIFGGFRDEWLLAYPAGLYEPPWRTPLPECGWGFAAGLGSVIVVTGDARMEGLIVDGHLVDGRVDGPLRRWALSRHTAMIGLPPPYEYETPPPGFALLPKYDTGPWTAFGASLGYVPDSVRIQIQGAGMGDYDLMLRTGNSVVHWRAFAGDDYREEFWISGLSTGRVQLAVASEYDKRCELYCGSFDPGHPAVTRVTAPLKAGAPMIVGRPARTAGWDVRFEGVPIAAEVAFGPDLETLDRYSVPAAPAGVTTRVHAPAGGAPDERMLTTLTPGTPDLVTAQQVIRPI